MSLSPVQSPKTPLKYPYMEHQNWADYSDEDLNKYKHRAFHDPHNQQVLKGIGQSIIKAIGAESPGALGEVGLIDQLTKMSVHRSLRMKTRRGFMGSSHPDWILLDVYYPSASQNLQVQGINHESYTLPPQGPKYEPLNTSPTRSSFRGGFNGILAHHMAPSV